ncbi:metal ABC transporter solute-binding protein, Zn/Mn family [Nesterenkonia sp. F]|uniref:metal ABC transporter solute-binding protein, Zn/Mn family n=1 Tax=Nesterenkonia sp. F TaxID=795955 RepID=UPI000255CB4A|nr:zinc ABC transporter substrate-binding protein [Nesterenkonia sp. F]
MIVPRSLRRSARRSRRPAAAALLAAALLLSGCGPAGADGLGESGAHDDRPVVLTTFTVLADIVSQIGGDRVEVRSITPVGTEIHEYDPTPGDIRAATEADLVITNGLGLEAWFDQFIDHAEAPSTIASADVDPLPVTRLAGHPAAAEDLPTNPHAWLSPERGRTYVDVVEQALAELSPADSEVFAAHADSYRERLTEIAEDARTRLAAVEESTGSPAQVVTCEGAFSYLAEDLGLEEHYLWPINSDTEGTPQQVEAQIEHVRAHEVPTVFCETTVNDDAQRQVAEASGATLGKPLHVDSLSAPDGPVPSYLELLRHDLDLIISGAEAGVEESSESQDNTEDDADDDADEEDR